MMSQGCKNWVLTGLHDVSPSTSMAQVLQFKPSSRGPELEDLVFRLAARENRLEDNGLEHGAKFALS